MAYNVWETCVFVPGLTNSQCASWVQAWGFILALVVVFVAGSRAERLRRRNAADDERSRRKFAAQLTADVSAFVARVVHYAQQAREAQKPYVYDLASFDAYVRVLQGSLRPSEIPGAMVPSLVYSLRCLLRFRFAAERANEGDGITEPHLSQATGGTRIALNAAAKEAGVPPDDLLLRSESASDDFFERRRQKREGR